MVKKAQGRASNGQSDKYYFINFLIMLTRQVHNNRKVFDDVHGFDLVKNFSVTYPEISYSCIR